MYKAEVVFLKHNNQLTIDVSITAQITNWYWNARKLSNIYYTLKADS